MKIENTTYDRTKKTPFNGWNKINKCCITYDDNSKIRRNGKEISLQEFINANNQDCTIYQVYDKYMGNMKLTQQALCNISHKVADELSGMDLATALNTMNKAEQAWNNLPQAIKQEFGNSVQAFQKNGLQWAKNKIAEFNKPKQKVTEEKKENKE